MAQSEHVLLVMQILELFPLLLALIRFTDILNVRGRDAFSDAEQLEVIRCILTISSDRFSANYDALM